jgi:hypothetical protein
MVIVANQGDTEPQLISHKIKLGLKQYTIAFDVQKSSDETNLGYSWSEVTFGAGVPSYSEIVAAIIRSRYDDDRMQALINNHLLDDGDAEHEAEWDAMQKWRAEAKQKAKEILAAIEQES